MADLAWATNAFVAGFFAAVILAGLDENETIVAAVVSSRALRKNINKMKISE